MLGLKESTYYYKPKSHKKIEEDVKLKFEIEKLLGSDPAKRQEFYNKYQNIKKLSETGGL
jgi:hypothetical protein